MAECGPITVEAAFDPTTVAIANCSVSPNQGNERTEFTPSTTIENPNAVAASLDVGWFASDLPNGPGVALREGVGVPAGGTADLSPSFVPADVPELQEFLPEFQSVITARIIPGSVVEVPGALHPADQNGRWAAPYREMPSLAHNGAEASSTMAVTDGGRSLFAGCAGCKRRSRTLSKHNARMRNTFDLLG